MSVGHYEKDNPLADLILVEGTFAAEFLTDLAPTAVKVYLYLLYLCRHPELKLSSASAVAQAAGVSESEFSASIEHLSALKLIRSTEHPFSFEVLSALEAARSKGAYAIGSLTTYADFFTGIRSLFPGRNISTAEYDKARDWVELYGFSVEAALLLITHCIETKDASISFSYMDRVALSWANDGITSAEKAEEYLALYQAKHHDAARLLQYLGIKRTPTVDEMTLYREWTGKMGFDLKAIKAACSELTKTASPNFAYLNRVLQTLAGLGLTSEKEIRAYLAESDNDRRLVSLLLAELGDRSRAVTQTHLDALASLLAAGFAPNALIVLAKTQCEKGFHTFTRFHETAQALAQRQIFDEESIRKEAETVKKSEPQKTVKSPSFVGRRESYDESLYADPDPLGGQP